MDYQALQTELNDDPQSLGYGGVADGSDASVSQDIADAMAKQHAEFNQADRDVIRAKEVEGIKCSRLAAIINSLGTGQERDKNLVIETWKIYAEMDENEYNLVLSDATKAAKLGHILALGQIHVSDPVLAREMKNIFGLGSTTLTNLADLKKETVSRAAKIGLGKVRVGDVHRARLL